MNDVPDSFYSVLNENHSKIIFFLHLTQLCSWLEGIQPSALAQNTISKCYIPIISSLVLILTYLNKSSHNFLTKLEATYLRSKSRIKDYNNAY